MKIALKLFPVACWGGGGGGSDSCFTAAILKPLRLLLPNFVTFSFYPLDIFWQNFRKLNFPGGSSCFSFFIEMSVKNVENLQKLSYN